MTKPPLVSSKRTCAAFERLGFVRTRTASGSHQMYSRERQRGVVDAIVIPLGKKQIDRWTLKAILREANVTLEEFVAALR